MITLDDQWLTETVALFDKYIHALAAKEMAIAAEGQALTMLKGQLVRLLANASSQSSAPPVPVNTVLPTISGTAQVGQTLTCSGGTWTGLGANPVYEHQWQESVAPFTTWADISGATASTYVVQAGQVDKVVRCGKRVSGDYGYSLWSYSAPSGIVVASGAPGSAPTINTPASFTASTPVYVGATVQINAPTVTGATAWWVRLVRDGVVVGDGASGPGTPPIASDTDTFPVSYTVTTEDIGTTFELRTYASNAAGVTESADTSDIGPIALAPSGAITDLGSFTATKDFILQHGAFDSMWAPTGTATKTPQAFTSAQTFFDYWNSTVKTGALTERYDITLDWNGMSAATAGETGQITLSGPAGTVGWADNGGWVKITAAPGKKPAFANRIKMQNWRGVKVDGVRFAGETNATTVNYCVQVNVAGSFNAEPIIIFDNFGIGRNVVQSQTDPTFYNWGLFVTSGIADQLTFTNGKISGVYVPLKIPARKTVIDNVDASRMVEDNIKFFGHTKSGYYAYVKMTNYTVRDCVLDYAYRAGHKDLWQTGVNTAKKAVSPSTRSADWHLGYRIYAENVISNNEHKYSGGGSQGFYNDDYFDADNLFAIKNCVALGISPNSMTCFSPLASYVSYIENVTMGRCGTSPSGFSPDTGTPVDWNPGVAPGANKNSTNWASYWQNETVGIKFKYINCIAGRFPTLSNASYSGCQTVDWTAAQSGVIPENVFNGADFERGGPSSNSTPNKFGFTIDQATTQANFVTAMNANFTPQGAYASKGCPAMNPANFTAPAS